MPEISYRQGIGATIATTFLGGLGVTIVTSLGSMLGTSHWTEWATERMYHAWYFAVTSYPTPGWVMLLMCVLSLSSLTFAFLCIRSRSLGLSTMAQAYGLTWRWKWNGSQMSDLWCYCPRCDSELVAPYENQYISVITGEVYTDNRLVCERCEDDGTLIKDDPRFRNPDPTLAVVDGMGRVIANMPGSRSEFVDRAKREILRTRRSDSRGTKKDREPKS